MSPYGAGESNTQQDGVDASGAVVTIDSLRLPGSRWPVALEPILGRSPLQRHLFHFERIGVEHCAVLLGTGEDAHDVERECARQIAMLALREMRVTCRARDDSPVQPARDERDYIVVARGSTVCDPRLYDAVVVPGRPRWVADSPQSRSDVPGTTASPVGLARLDVGALSRQALEPGEGQVWAALADGLLEPGGRLDVGDLPSYVPSMRRHLRPFWCDVHTTTDRRRATRLILDAAQKGVLDFPARFLHPVPENLLAHALAGTRITPNQVTILTGIIAFAATYLFASQAFAWGLVLALLVNVLDGVDGKLARITLQMSAGGDRLDHTLDVAFEFSWYIALGWGLSQVSGNGLALRLGFGLIGVMIASRALAGVYKLRTGRQIHDHRAFDRAFRLVAGRRNIYVMVLVVGVLAGHLMEAFIVVFGGGVVTALVYLVRSVMVLGARAA